MRAKPNKEKRFLLAIQFWEQDKKQALRLAKLLTQLRPEGYDIVDLALVHRFDCEPPKAREFEDFFKNIYVLGTTRRETGHPGGCNGMWHDLMDQSYYLHKNNQWEYEFLLTTEADSCPLIVDWDEKLMAAWLREPGVVMGHWIKQHSTVGHINGNALFDPCLTSMSQRLIGTPHNKSWDTWHAPLFKKLGWADIPEIRSHYDSKNFDSKIYDDLAKAGCVWLHGYKDDSLFKFIQAISE